MISYLELELVNFKLQQSNIMYYPFSNNADVWEECFSGPNSPHL